MTRIAIFPGTFDPPTRGHEDLIRRSRSLADQVIVAIGDNVGKQALFSVAERLDLLRSMVGSWPGVEVATFSGLLADFARLRGAQLIVRGLRVVADFDYELQRALMNRHLNDQLETVFLAPATNLTFVSSTLVREVARFGGDVGALVPPVVGEALRRKFST
ncbi:MAG TPA: pantetheine-phosphate adenylyltransferase [Gemmatimonadales bacterium]